MKKLNSFWPNLKMGPNGGFWKHEYETHGSCFFPTQEKYFESIVQMTDRIPYLFVIFMIEDS